VSPFIASRMLDLLHLGVSFLTGADLHMLFYLSRPKPSPWLLYRPPLYRIILLIRLLVHILCNNNISSFGSLSATIHCGALLFCPCFTCDDTISFHLRLKKCFHFSYGSLYFTTAFQHRQDGYQAWEIPRFRIFRLRGHLSSCIQFFFFEIEILMYNIRQRGKRERWPAESVSAEAAVLMFNHGSLED
jgi:hypothetical protein